MSRADPDTRLLITGLVVSTIAHASVWAVASGFVRIGDERPSAKHAAAIAPKPRPPERKPLIHLGIDDSKSAGLAWLGYAEETENFAPQSTVDQSAMSPNPGAAAAATAPPAAPPKLEQPPVPQLRSSQVEESAQAIIEAGKKISEALRQASRPPSPDQPPQQAQTSQNTAAAPAPAAKAQGTPGLPSDKESLAASVKKAPSVKPGQVLAANGLDIQTKAPKWSVTTQQTRRPANPTVQITFGRDGKVVRAGFATDGVTIYSSGYEDVDEPLLSAVYSWVARGKKLKEYTSQDPNGEVTILITIILN